ncbi:MAG TPA: cupin domain-containing protein [Planctomycetaceae bacterium]|nr:cupin domain-containing protein [Planctomycetaceae bacterium]
MFKAKEGYQLDDLLSPTATEIFFRDTWEKSPLLVSRGDAGHFAGLLSLRDVDNVIAYSRPVFNDQTAFRSKGPGRATYVRGLLAGQPPMAPAENPGLAELRQVFDQGTSVVIMAMQHRWPAVAALCRNLEAVFHCPIHANMYLTPPGAQGFAAHFDPHEVFVLQLEGVKRWRLYDRVEVLPAADSLGTPKLPLGNAREVCLEAGDFLYLPRGHVHEAYTQDALSLHLTIGVNVYRWSDLLHHALSAASRQDMRFRGSIPGGALPDDSGDAKQRFKDLLAALAQEEFSESLFSPALQSLGDQFFGELTMLPGRQFGDTTDHVQIDLETVLERSRETMCRVVDSDQGAAIEFPGNRVAGPPRIASSLRFISNAERFSVREIPGDLNDEAKIVLARRLVREGLLTVVTPCWPGAKSFCGADSTHVNGNSAQAPGDWETAEPARQVQQAVSLKG